VEDITEDVYRVYGLG